MSVDTKERMDDLEKLIQRFSDAEFSCGEAEVNTEEFTEALRGADVAERNLRKYVHTLLSRLSVLEGALSKCIRQFENMDESAPVDVGCIECTAGTVPNNRNTGLCGYHAAKAAVTGAT